MLFEYDYGFEEFYDTTKHHKPTSLCIQTIKLMIKDDLELITNNEKGLLTEIDFLEDSYQEIKSQIQLNTNEKLESIKIIDKLKLDFANIMKILKLNKNDSNDDTDDKEQAQKNIKDRRQQIKLKAKKINDNQVDNSIAYDFFFFFLFKIYSFVSCFRKIPKKHKMENMILV